MSEGAPRSLDDLFDVLASRQRRWLLHDLRARDEPATLSELARDLGSTATDGGDREVEERRLRIRLHHVHVPRLVTADLVEYDEERRLLTATNRLEQVAPVLDWAADFRPREA